jgi:chromosome segregation ATPase
MTLGHRESQYEKQIKEYENNLNQATRNTENMQAELANLAQEKASHDKKSNNTIESLKQDYERQYEMLKSQLTELQDRGLINLRSFISLSLIR